MRALETATALEGFGSRGAGTNSERRAAHWLAAELMRGGRESVVEPFWCRPNWQLAHMWHVGLALAGSLVSVASGPAGAAMLLVALVSILADALTGVSPGRRLTPERASQNVIATPRRDPATPVPRVRLIITANYDAGRAGLVYRDRFRRIARALERATLGASPGWLGWISLTILGLLVIAILRVEGHHSRAIGAIQLVPTVVLVFAVALLLELATADPGPAAGDNGTGVGVAVELVRALDAAPPRHLSAELVLQGAGDAGGIGLRRYLGARRTELSPAATVVLGVAACGGGLPRWWTSDGPFVPLLYNRQLARLCAQTVADDPDLGARPHAGRGAAPALQARLRRRPAISIGCLDQRGLAPRSHQRIDTSDAIDPAALDQAVQFGLILVDQIDAWLADNRSRQVVTQA